MGHALFTRFPKMVGLVRKHYLVWFHNGVEVSRRVMCCHWMTKLQVVFWSLIGVPWRRGIDCHNQRTTLCRRAICLHFCAYRCEWRFDFDCFFPPVWCDALWIVLSAGQVQNTYHFFFCDSTSRTKWTGSRFAVVMKKLKWMVCWSRLRSWKIKFHWFWTWGPPCRNFFISNLTYLMLPTLVLQSVCRCWNVVAVVKQWQLSMALPMRIGLNFVGIENGTENTIVVCFWVVRWNFNFHRAIKFWNQLQSAQHLFSNLNNIKTRAIIHSWFSWLFCFLMIFALHRGDSKKQF